MKKKVYNLTIVNSDSILEFLNYIFWKWLGGLFVTKLKNANKTFNLNKLDDVLKIIHFMEKFNKNTFLLI